MATAVLYLDFGESSERELDELQLNCRQLKHSKRMPAEPSLYAGKWTKYTR